MFKYILKITWLKMTVPDLETRAKFESTLNEWAEHLANVAHMSNPNCYLNCDAFRKLVGMGPKILPLIREVYEPDYLEKRGIIKDETRDFGLLRDLGLAMLVGRLAGDDFYLPRDEQLKGKELGNVNATTKFTMGWLDFNMYKYS
jgi:hypothetical protein